MKTTIAIVLFFMASLEITSSNHKTPNEIPNKVNIKRSYADILSSLIKVNQERVKALKKLYLLNSLTYGKNALRSNIEQRLDEYDKMEASLIRTSKRILDEIKHAPKASIDENDVNEILKTNVDHFILSNSENILAEPNEMNNQLEMRKLKNVLRNNDSDDDDDSSKEEDNSGSKADSKSSSIEKENEKFEKSLQKENEEFENEVNANRTKGRSYYIIEYGCGRGRIRCIKACKEAYRYACDIYECRSSLRSELRHSCKIECREWFY